MVLGDVLDRDAELLRLDPVDIDKDLRRVRRERREHGGQSRRLARRIDEFVGRGGQQLRAAALPVLDAHGEAATGADTRDRRRRDHDDEGALDRGKSLAQIGRDDRCGQSLLQTHFRLVEHRKQGRRVACLRAGRARQSRKGRNADDAGRIERGELDPPHDLGGPR